MQRRPSLGAQTRSTHTIAVAAPSGHASAVSRATDSTSSVVASDVSTSEDIRRMVDSVNRRGGGVDIALTNAGTIDNSAAKDMTVVPWRRMIDLTGVFLCSQAVQRLMITQGRDGSIVHVSSGCAHSVVSPQAPCHDNATTADVTMLTTSRAAEWAPRGIRVNAVSHSNVTPVPVASMGEVHPTWQGRPPRSRLGQPHEIADAHTFPAGLRAGVVTGSDGLVDGGCEW